MKKIIKKIEGIFTKKDEIAPAYINTKNPKNIEIDGTYYSGIIIVNYNRENTELILRKIIDTNINMNISCFYEKQDAYKTIRNLSYHIANVGVDLLPLKYNMYHSIFLPSLTPVLPNPFYFFVISSFPRTNIYRNHIERVTAGCKTIY